MKVSRRDFLKISAGAGAAATFVNQDILEKALALILQNSGNAQDIVWIHGQNCTGCTISAIEWCGNVGGAYYANLINLLVTVGTDLEFHPTLMPQAGCYYSADGETYRNYQFSEGSPSDPEDETYVDAMNWLVNTVDNAPDNSILVVWEGAIPYEKWGDNEDMGFCEIGMKKQGTDGSGDIFKEGKMWMAADLAKYLHNADSVVAFVAYGNCGAFGGIPGGNPNPTGSKGLAHFFEDAATSAQFAGDNPLVLGPSAISLNGLHKPVINLNGCPPPADHLALVYAAFLLNPVGGSPGLDSIQLDRWYRPTQIDFGLGWVNLYGEQVHDKCERKKAFDEGDFAFTFDEAIDDPSKCLLKLGCRGVDAFTNCSDKFIAGNFAGQGVAGGWNPNGVGFWNHDRSNPIDEVNPGTWCVAAGSPCYGCSTTTFPDNVLGRSFFIECTHAEMLDTCELPGACSSAPEMQGLTCYTCHSVTMPRKYKKWITPEYGYGFSYGYYYNYAGP